MKRHITLGFYLTLAGATLAAPPDFHEVFGLVSSNLTGVDQAQLEKAAIKGLEDEFPGRVSLADNDENQAGATPITKGLASASVLDGTFAYFRVTKVTPGLPEELKQTWPTLEATNKGKIRGVVLDLRFADGTDYAAAGNAVDSFLTVGEPLLEWPGGSVASSNKESAITAPVAILINGKTAGAAEALAAALRASDRALTVGSKTAGEANVYKEFNLTTGQKLRIANGEVKLAGGPALTGGIAADIPVTTTLADDRAYLTDPFKALHTDGETNAPEPRFNEAELVKEHRAGLEPGEGLLGAPGEASGPPAVADPTLSRALDVLKGLAVLNGQKPG